MPEKIESLKSEEVDEAARVYVKGISMEIPPGSATMEGTRVILKKMYCFVHKTGGCIDGVVTFRHRDESIDINFICALTLRRGIGKALMERVAAFGLDKNVDYIYSTVSSEDERVMKFYDYCGFKKYDEYFEKEVLLLHAVKATPSEILNAIRKKSASP